MKNMMHGQPMECSLGGFRLPQRQRHQKERPHREVAQKKRKNEIPHKEVAYIKDIQLREVARGTKRGHHGKKEKDMKGNTDSQKRQEEHKGELKTTRLQGPT